MHFHSLTINKINWFVDFRMFRKHFWTCHIPAEHIIVSGPFYIHVTVVTKKRLSRPQGKNYLTNTFIKCLATLNVNEYKKLVQYVLSSTSRKKRNPFASTRGQRANKKYAIFPADIHQQIAVNLSGNIIHVYVRSNSLMEAFSTSKPLPNCLTEFERE